MSYFVGLELGLYDNEFLTVEFQGKTEHWTMDRKMIS